MRYVTKAILASFIIVLTLTAAGIAIIYTQKPTQPPTDNNNNEQPPATNTTFSSFEDNMDNWTANGTDLLDPPIVWHINRTTHQSYSGNASIELFLSNMNDAGKIWIQKSLQADPNTQYFVTVTYQLGTSDYGLTTFTIITGVDNQPPLKAGLTFQDSTDDMQDNGNLTWLTKSYDFVTTTNDTGLLYASIGVWGTFETNRTYYIDDVTITFTKIEQSHNVPGVGGNWTMQTFPRGSNETQTENVTITQRTTITIHFESGENTTGIIIPTNVLPAPAQATNFVIWGCSIHGIKTPIYIVDDTMLIAYPLYGTVAFSRR
jgi:hypothetical protein